MVYLEGERTPVFKHEDVDRATTEAQRLARTHRKKAFVLCTIKSIELDEFKTEDLRPNKEDDDFPF
jgi:hypothetical protein